MTVNQVLWGSDYKQMIVVVSSDPKEVTADQLENTQIQIQSKAPQSWTDMNIHALSTLYFINSQFF